MAIKGGAYIWYFYRGDGEHVPDETTHIFVHLSCDTVFANSFRGHRNIVQVICHDGVKKIGREAFWGCPSLTAVIMPGVKEVELGAFSGCTALSYIECDRLEIIGAGAFTHCDSFRVINLPSARTVEAGAFDFCEALTAVNFGRELETIEWMTFCECRSMEQIRIPLKGGLFTDDDVFIGCEKLKHVELCGLPEFISALQLEGWRYDVNKEIDSFNQILQKAPPGHYSRYLDEELIIEGEKVQVIETMIASVIGKLMYYRAEHQRLLNEAATSLMPLALPQDIVFKSVLPFLELPSNYFG